MLETPQPPVDVPGISPESIVWEDDVWVLARHEAGDLLGLTLHHRDEEGLGQLSDEHASQLGRIGNRLVRIIENLADPGTGNVSLGRIPGGRTRLTFEVAGVSPDRLHDVAVKLANWGGDARA